MKLIRALSTFVAILFCTFSAKGEPFVYYPQISPTPIKNAPRRYSQFLYHYRLSGTKDFTVVAPISVNKTDDGSVEAKFKIVVPNVVPHDIYESFYSYLLDGKEVSCELDRTTLISTKSAEQDAAANP
jgi:hypothetical protein